MLINNITFVHLYHYYQLYFKVVSTLLTTIKNTDERESPQES